MTRQSLLEYLRPDSRPADEPAVVWRRGYRTMRWTSGELLRTASQCAVEFAARGIQKGDRILLWGENSGEWIAAFLGCLLCGAVAVPMDAIAEETFVHRVIEQAGVRLAVVGNGLSLPPGLPVLTLDDLANAIRERSIAGFSPVAAGRGDLVEIVFTSGTTAEPRGVVLTHGNVLANLEPIEKEIERYRRYERIFHPLRFLDLLPLSHVFGQLLGIFLPRILGSVSVFLDTLNPSEVIHVIRAERVSILVTVPRLIESLRTQIERDLAASDRLAEFQRDFQTSAGRHFLMRWWTFRAIHRRFGWKFWAIISGGAALPAAAEEFWGRLGYAVIQGYGLTETTSLVAVNHPFRLGRRSIGKALPGLEVKLSKEGEILVRGGNVASGYWKDSAAGPILDAEGWFHTGDLGERAADGTLYFKGRRKNVIVTPEGLNVYPEDLENELRKEPEIRDCVVLGLERDGNAEPVAVLLLRDSAAASADTARAAVQRANERLAPFQRMRRWFVWPGADFPRTPTLKPALASMRETLLRESERRENFREAVSASPEPLSKMIARISGGRPLPRSDEEALSLSSIERVELLSAIEDRYQVDLSETDFANAETTGAIKRLIEQPLVRQAAYAYPRWPQALPARILRAAARHLLMRPAMKILGWPRIHGRDNLRGLQGPALVIANHSEYFDPAYVLEALPEHMRRRLAVAMDGERLEAMRRPSADTPFLKRLAERAGYWGALLVFNVFPLPRRAGFRRSFAFAGELVDRGWSILVFPEGELTKDGHIGPFRSGIGLLAARLGVPVVPLRMEGIFDLKRAGRRFARPGEIRIFLGAPVRFSEADAAEAITGELQRRVAALGDVSGE